MKKIVAFFLMLLVGVSVMAQPAKKVRRTASNTQEAVTERQISSRFNKGLRAYYTAQYEEALQIFSGILSDAPKHAPSYYMLSRVYAGREQYVDAESAIKQAVKIDKNNIWYQIALAESYLTTANYKLALPLWEKICREKSENRTYLSNLAMCYEKIGASDKANELRTRINRLDPKADEEQPVVENQALSTSSSDHKTMGINSLKSQQYAQAVSYLEQALKEDDTDYDVWSTFAEAVAKSQQWRKLTDKEDDLTTLFPQSSALLSVLAEAFLQTGQPEKAVEYYQQARAFAFESAQIQTIKKGLFDAYTAMGDTENADRYR